MIIAGLLTILGFFSYSLKKMIDKIEEYHMYSQDSCLILWHVTYIFRKLMRI